MTVHSKLNQKKIQSLETLKLSVFGESNFYQNIVNESYSGNIEVQQKIIPILTAWYPSQVFQAFTNGLILFFLLTLIWWGQKKEGVLSGCFLVIYGAFRILTESFRQPDVGVSIIFGLIGAWLLFSNRRKNSNSLIPNHMKAFALIFGFLAMYTSSAFARLELFGAIGLIILGAIGLTILL